LRGAAQRGRAASLDRGPSRAASHSQHRDRAVGWQRRRGAAALRGYASLQRKARGPQPRRVSASKAARVAARC
jgi:hypothetical protein